ncbi:hypothetical protein FRB99_004434 [Tulasnella sp. 403]|nr:hypothetical protein FRB99_004434 [Tulasnella sp. 403]
MDSSAIAQDARAQRFSTKSGLNELYKQLTKRRELEIKAAVAAGLVDDPTARRTLDNAIDIIGTCQDFCPEFERVERHLRNEVKRPEMKPGSDTEPDYSRMVKAFARPNDSNNIKLPSEIRPPPVLQARILFSDCFPTGPHAYDMSSFNLRKPAIRQDFTIQGGKSPIAVECHERIARFHILSLHESRIGAQEDQDWETELRAAYSLNLDIAQLNKTLTTLMQYYDDYRAEGVLFPNEAEFRAYRLLLQFRDADVARRTQRVPFDVIASPWIQSALDLRNLAQYPSNVKTAHPGLRAVPYALSRIIKELQKPTVSFLMACLMESHFMSLRKETLRSMASTYISKTTPVEKCTRLLGFETDAQTIDFVKDCGLTVEEASKSTFTWKPAMIPINRIERNKITDFTPKESKTQSLLLVNKRGSYSWKDIIDGAVPPPIARPTPPASFTPSLEISRLVSTTAPAIVASLPPPQPTKLTHAQVTAIPTSAPPPSFFQGFGQTSTPKPPSFGNFTSNFGNNASQFKFGSVNSAPFGANSSSFGSNNLFAKAAGNTPSFGFGAQPAAQPISTSATSAFTAKPPAMSAFSSTPPVISVAPPQPAPQVTPAASPAVPASSTLKFGGTSKLSPFAVPFIPNITRPREEPPVVPTLPQPAKPDPQESDPVKDTPALVRIAAPSAPVQPLAPLSPRVDVVARKPSIASVPASPPAPSPRSLSRIKEEQNALLATKIMHIMLTGMAQTEVAGAFAEAWRRRRTLRRTLKQWYEKYVVTREVREAEEMAYQEAENEKAARWQRLMSTLDHSHPVPDPHSGPKKWKGKEKEQLLRPAPISVEEMQRVVSDATRATEMMWRGGVFLDAIHRRISVIVEGTRRKNDIMPEDWDVWLYGQGGATWRWLRVKFGLDPGDDDLVDQAFVIIPLSGISEMNYPGLIVFELSPLLATSPPDQRNAIWETDMQRLGGILSQLPDDRPYQPTLMILYWGDANSDQTAQQSIIRKRITSYLEPAFPEVVTQVVPVVFKDPETYHEAFETAIQHAPLDITGKMLVKYPLRDVISSFSVVWEAAMVEGITICESHRAEHPSVKWRACARLFSLLVEGLAKLEESVSDVVELINEDGLPPFRTEGISDESAFWDGVIEYLGSASLADDVLLVTLRRELQAALSKQRPPSIRIILDQLAWYVTSRLLSLGTTVLGYTWENALEIFKLEMLNKIGSLAAFVDAEAKLLETSARTIGGPAMKKRGRIPSGDRTVHLPKRTRIPDDSDVDMEPNDVAFLPPPTPSPPRVLKSDLADLERLIAESEAMLAN